MNRFLQGLDPRGDSLSWQFIVAAILAAIILVAFGRFLEGLVPLLLVFGFGITRSPPVERRGTMAWNPPQRMRVETPVTVLVAMGRAEVRAAIPDIDVDSDSIRHHEIEAASRMRAELKFDVGDFTTETLGSSDQDLDLRRQSVWRFRVTPLKSGCRKLALIVSLLRKDGQVVRVLDPLEHDVEVRPTLWPTIRSSLKLLIVKVVLPVLVVIIAAVIVATGSPTFAGKEIAKFFSS